MLLQKNDVGRYAQLRNGRVVKIQSHKEQDIWCFKGDGGLAWRKDGMAGLSFEPTSNDIVCFTTPTEDKP